MTLAALPDPPISFRGRGVIAESGGGPEAAPKSGNSRLTAARAQGKEGSEPSRGLVADPPSPHGCASEAISQGTRASHEGQIVGRSQPNEDVQRDPTKRSPQSPGCGKQWFAVLMSKCAAVALWRNCDTLRQGPPAVGQRFNVSRRWVGPALAALALDGQRFNVSRG